MNQQKSAHYPHLLGQGREISLLIHPCHCQHCTSTTGLVGSTSTPQTDNDAEWEKAIKEYRRWVLCRMIGSSGKHPMPAFGGFISATGKTPDKKSTIVYYPPINGPITAYNTVAELLKRSAEATAEVGQKYTIVTFDLGVCMKALPLIWTFSEQYKDHIVVIGQFHTSMNYLNMLGHKNIYFQEETDTRVVLYLQYAESSGFKDAVVRSPDSDIFFILLHYASSFKITIYLDTGTWEHCQLINVTALSKSLCSDYATALMGLYVFTGDDCNIAFKGKGKVPP